MKFYIIKPHFDELVKYMTSGESCVLALSKEGNSEDVIYKWREDIGPTDIEEVKKRPDTLRAQYATDQLINALHGSDSQESAMKELAFFFPNPVDKSNHNQHKNEQEEEDNHANKEPAKHVNSSLLPPALKSSSPQPSIRQNNQQQQNQRTIAIIRPSAFAQHKDKILQRIKDSGFDIAMKRQVTFDRQTAEEFYSEHRDKPYFDDLCNEMTNGPMLVLCLVKENAVKAWRDLLGPKEKEQIKQASGTLD